MYKPLAFALMLLATPVLAAPSGSYSTPAPATGEITAATGLIEAGRYEQAILVLSQVVERRPRNADALNLLGYAHRKSGDFTQSRVFYTRALEANPNHDGALSYMAELELQEGNVAAARTLYNRLRVVCPLGCDALEDLDTAFANAGLSATS